MKLLVIIIPKGILWLKWDNRTGILVDWQYPNSLRMSIKEAISIYSSQTLGNTVIPRFSHYASEDFNIASYFGGELNRDMVILSLEIGEDPRDYKLKLIDLYYKVLRGEFEYIKDDKEFSHIFGNNSEATDEKSVQLGTFEKRFDIFLSIFNNFIGTIDRRLTQIENLIIKTISSKKE